MWLDLDYDGSTDPYCVVDMGSSGERLLQSICKEVQDFKFEENTERWILICVKENTDSGGYELYLETYSSNGDYLSSSLIQNSLMTNGIRKHILLDVNQDGNIDLLYGNNPAKVCIDIMSVLDFSVGCLDLAWETPWGYIDNFESIFYHDFDGDGDIDVGLEQGIIEITDTGMIHHRLFDSYFYSNSG